MAKTEITMTRHIDLYLLDADTREILQYKMVPGDTPDEATIDFTGLDEDRDYSMSAQGVTYPEGHPVPPPLSLIHI